MKWFMKLGMICTILVLAACSSDDTGKSEESNRLDQADSSADMVQSNEKGQDQMGTEEQVEHQKDTNTDNRMIMYHARLTLNIKDIDRAVEDITSRTNQINGYVVETASMNRDENVQSHMTLRIPNPELQSFIKKLEKLSEKVVEKRVRGEDVTEEYTDLESRLKAKKVVENRLLDFMKGAKKTEDLLNISKDLAKVQEEIEQMEGKIKYLENRTEFAEVSITLNDISVNVPGIAEEDLQTGERIQKAFTNSLNQLSSFFSGAVVFLIGYSPFLIMLVIFGGAIWFFKKRKVHKDTDS
ncbi:DUF4349 domain-containing protein [Virgibacillus sp. MSP4-1]|uniref:DUF4349 domain-containing protein n=1 Tax=Virgibacillus sp. MSP4-1 TaxID=2700081 RepID=UPI00039C95DA|nr:DUF4349 domain-containing protein [Virgibacillus sp. MSP4-1]QHS22476.1 DUF4349 domain-containing protein [Virgibacillus sp. MSP4-1]